MMTVDDEEFSRVEQIFETLKPERQSIILRSTMRRGATKLREMALAELKRTSLRAHSHRREIRKRVYKRALGFDVFLLGTKGQPQASSIGNKPILLWAEGGTVRRFTKNRFGRKGKGHTTWRMPGYGFMAATLKRAETQLSSELGTEAESQLMREIKKNGF